MSQPDAGDRCRSSARAAHAATSPSTPRTDLTRRKFLATTGITARRIACRRWPVRRSVPRRGAAPVAYPPAVVVQPVFTGEIYTQAGRKAGA